MFKFNGITADAQGRGGALGYLDQQLFKKYTLPIMTTALTSYASYMMADDKNSDGEIETPKQQAANDARDNFLSDMKQIFEQILAYKANIKPLTYVPAGTRIIIYPNTDLWIKTEKRSDKKIGSGTFEGEAGGRVLIDDKARAKQRAESNARAEVVYNAGESTPVSSSGDENRPVLIDDRAKAQQRSNSKASAGALPPPPPSTPAPTSTPSSSQSSSTSSIPQLF